MSIWFTGTFALGLRATFTKIVIICHLCKSISDSGIVIKYERRGAAQVDIRMERQPPPEARQMHVPVPCAAKRPGMEQSPPPQHALWHIRVPCEFHLPPISLATHGKTWEGGGERARESRGVGQTRSMPAAEQVHIAYSRGAWRSEWREMAFRAPDPHLRPPGQERKTATEGSWCSRPLGIPTTRARRQGGRKAGRAAGEEGGGRAAHGTGVGGAIREFRATRRRQASGARKRDGARVERSPDFSRPCEKSGLFRLPSLFPRRPQLSIGEQRRTEG